MPNEPEPVTPPENVPACQPAPPESGNGSAPAHGSETREETRKRLLATNEERLRRTRATLIESYREKDDEGIWMANALIAECERFKQRLEADAPASQNAEICGERTAPSG